MGELVKTHYKLGVEFCGKESITSAEVPDTPAAKAPADPAKAPEEEVKPAAKAEKKTVDSAALLSSLTKGLDVTKGLKKVKKSQKNKYKKRKKRPKLRKLDLLLGNSWISKTKSWKTSMTKQSMALKHNYTLQTASTLTSKFHKRSSRLPWTVASVVK